jgi:hypothetical protein
VVSGFGFHAESRSTLRRMFSANENTMQRRAREEEEDGISFPHPVLFTMTFNYIQSRKAPFCVHCKNVKYQLSANNSIIKCNRVGLCSPAETAERKCNDLFKINA